ncbi:hypothetical protein WJX72_005985 [[Myrmecia] bisecta]|uniref:Myb-like domain-containing protein n=1 Tax=[Myrmecia] bisecta TaxID=41462 RepID=A0AAW1QFB5_9CHLO
MVYVDEEEALPFHIWVAELELLTGNAKGPRKVDPVACFELLQKLLVTIDRTERVKLKEYQRRCEDALMEILLKGTAPPVRRLIGACLSRMYSVGDSLPLYARVSSLQQFLASKEALGRSVPEEVRVGALECLATLCYSHGRSLASGMPESMALAVKHCTKYAEPGVRYACLNLMAAVVEGLGEFDRNVTALQTEALKAAERSAKDPGYAHIRAAAAAVYRAVARAGGAALWAWGGSACEEAVRICIAALDDPSRAVAEAFAIALGEIAAAGKSNPALDAVRALDKKASKKAALEKLLADLFTNCLACVLYVLRVGVIEQLGESGQRLMLERLTALVASVLGSHVPLAVVTLEAMGLLLEVLGEVQLEMLSQLEEPVGWKLAADHSCLRSQAACVLAAMAVAEPSSAARLLEAHLTKLSLAAAKLASLAGPYGAQNPHPEPLNTGGPGTPRGLNAGDKDKLKPAMDLVHGCSLGTAALLVASTRLPLGVPTNLILDALDLAQRLICKPESQRASGWSVEREAGYIVLGALCISLPAEIMEERRMTLLDLWQPALSPESALQLDLKKYLTTSVAGGEAIMAMEMWWRAAALEALLAFVKGPLAQARRSESTKLQRAIGTLLQPTLDAVCSAPSLQDPNKGKGGPAGIFAGAAALLQLRLLEVFLALPNANAFAPEHEALSKLCARPVRGSSASASPGAASAVASSTLRQLLNKQDAVLGPWVPGRDPLEDALQAFAGAPGGPPHHPWEAGLGFSAGYVGGDTMTTGGEQALVRNHAPFPQPKSLGAALLEAQLVLLGNLLAVVSEANQLQILEVMTVAADGGPGKKKEKDPTKRNAIVTSVCSAAIAGLDVLAHKYRGEVESRDNVATTAWGLAQSVLAEGAASAQPALQRSAAEMCAFAACIGTDAFAAQLVRSICKDMAETSSAARRAALALAVGCIFRSKGGLSMQNAVGLTAETLFAVAQGSGGFVHLWLLHGLWLAANAAGLAFVQQVKPTLALALQLLMSEEAYSVAGLRPAVGRLANALVAVLGPELTLGSDPYVKCKALIREMQAEDMPASGGVLQPEDATAAELETVLYAQMLILFAPQAVPAQSHLPRLLATLTSRQPALRQAAAATLRHLAERDPAAMLPARIEGRLFAALDNETDSAIAGQITDTLRTLLYAGSPREPSHWLTACADVVLAAGPAGKGSSVAAAAEGQAAPQSASAEPGGLMYDEDADTDDDAGAEPAVPPPASAPAAEAPATASSTAGMRMAASATPRLRTRLFAARCILEIPTAVGSDVRHFDMAGAHHGDKGAGKASGDWLVLRLQMLIDVGFKMATGQVEGLRPMGLKLLKLVIKRFGDAADPLMEGHRILEQYQAQLVAALRSALARGSGPTLAAAGAALAATFLERGLATGDAAVLTRLMSLLTEPLSDWASPKANAYAEWVGVRAKVALLEAHAHCAVFAAACEDDVSRQIVLKSHAPYKRQLVDLWSALLQDFAVITTQPPLVQAAYQPRLFSSAAATVIPSVQHYLHRAWPAALEALAATLLVDTETSDQANGSELTPELYALLLDVCQLAVSEATSAGVAPAGQHAALRRRLTSSDGAASAEALAGLSTRKLLTSLKALQRLLGRTAWQRGLLGQEECADILGLLQRVLLEAAAPVGQASTAHSQLRPQLVSAGLDLLQRASTGVQLAAAQAYLEQSMAALAQHAQPPSITPAGPESNGNSADRTGQAEAAEWEDDAFQEASTAGWRPAGSQQEAGVAEASTSGSLAMEQCLEVLEAAISSKLPASMQSGRSSSLPAPEVQVVAETLKLLVVALSAFAKLGEAAQQGIMALLLPLLIETAAPEGEAHPALVDMAVKLSHPDSGGASFNTSIHGQEQVFTFSEWAELPQSPLDSGKRRKRDAPAGLVAARAEARRACVRGRAEMSGGGWSDEEARQFYAAFESVGQNWGQVAQLVGSKSAEACEALFKQHAGYLTLPVQFRHEVAFLAMVKDHHNNVFKEENSADTISERDAANGSTMSGAHSVPRPSSGAKGRRTPRARGGAAPDMPAPKATPTKTPQSTKISQRKRKTADSDPPYPEASWGYRAGAGRGGASGQGSPRPGSGILDSSQKRKRVQAKLQFDSDFVTSMPMKGTRAARRDAADPGDAADALLSLASLAHPESSTATGSLQADERLGDQPSEDARPDGPSPRKRGGELANDAAAPYPAASPAKGQRSRRNSDVTPRKSSGRRAKRAEPTPSGSASARGSRQYHPGFSLAGFGQRLANAELRSGSGLAHRRSAAQAEPSDEEMEQAEEDEEMAYEGRSSEEAEPWRSGEPLPRQRPRKSAPEKPALVSPMRSLFGRKTGQTPLAYSLGLPSPSQGDAADGTMNPAEERLRRFLSPASRRWAMYEFFYSAIDRPWFTRSELQDYLSHMGMAHVERLTRTEWGIIRASLGRPRRLSLNFLREERAKLEAYRENVRAKYDEVGLGGEAPADLPRALQVAQRVTARHPVTQQLHDGDVLTVAPTSCRIQFDRRELGVELVKDIDIMPLDPTECLPPLTLASAQRMLANGRPLAGQPLVHRPAGKSWQDGTPARGPAAGRAQQQARAAAAAAGLQGSREADVSNLVEVTAALDKKEALLLQLRTMNDEAEAGVHNTPSGERSEAFQQAYAAVVLQIKQINERLEASMFQMQGPAARSNPQAGAVVATLQRAGVTPATSPRPAASTPVTPLAGAGPPTSAGPSPILDASNPGWQRVWGQAQGMVRTFQAQIADDQAWDAGQEPAGPSSQAAGGQQTHDTAAAGQQPPTAAHAAQDSAAAEAEHGYKEGSDEAAKLQSIVAGCVSMLITLQEASESPAPAVSMAAALDTALQALQPHAETNRPIYEQIQASVGVLKSQLMPMFT